MNFRKFWILLTSLIILSPTTVNAQMSIRNGNTIVETDGNGRVRIFIDKNGNRIYHQNHRLYPYYQWLPSDSHFEYNYPRKNCYQYHRQTSSSHGSGRRVTQNSVSKCS